MSDYKELTPTVTDPDTQRAVWFLGALVRERLGGDSTGDALAVLEHHGRHGYNSPLHRHIRDDETFVVLDGSVRVQAEGVEYVAGAGSSIFLPKMSTHGFVVATGLAKFLTVHTPSGFDKFVLDAGDRAVVSGDDLPTPPEGTKTLSPEELTKIAATYGIEIVGPPPVTPPLH
jgi:quercetin dioxygenase-like cupin family protein